MRVILRITEGPDREKKIWLREHQSLSIGRTERADQVVAGDGLISGVHFKLSCDDASCQIADQLSTNGTYVNNQRIQESTLRTGDVIVAGKTHFFVTIESDADVRRSVSGLPPIQMTQPDPASPPAAESKNKSEPPMAARVDGPSRPKRPPKARTRPEPHAEPPSQAKPPPETKPPMARPAEPRPAQPTPESERSVVAATVDPPQISADVPSWLVDLYRRYIDEAAFYYAQRLEWLEDETIPWPEVESVENDFEARMDGLMIGEEVAVQVCHQQFLEAGGDDPGVLHVVTRVFLRNEQRELFDLVIAQLNPDQPEMINAVADAMRDEFPEHWQEDLRKQLASSPPQLALAAGKLLTLREIEADDDLIRVSTTASAAALPEMNRTLGRLKNYRARDSLMDSFALEGEPAVNASSAIAMLCIGAPHVIGQCLRRIDENWPLIAIGLGGGQNEAAAMMERHQANPHPHSALALGLLGDIRAVPLLQASLGDDKLAQDAALALYLLTGAELAEEADVLAEPEGDPGKPSAAPDAPQLVKVTRLSQNPDDWQAWWQANGSHLDPKHRYRGCQLYSPQALVDLLRADQTPQRLRYLAFEELIIRYDRSFSFDTELPVSQQRQALRDIENWVQAYGSRFEPGRWYFAGSVLA